LLLLFLPLLDFLRVPFAELRDPLADVSDAFVEMRDSWENSKNLSVKSTNFVVGHLHCPIPGHFQQFSSLLSWFFDEKSEFCFERAK
jgi:hypothetical protein